MSLENIHSCYLSYFAIISTCTKNANCQDGTSFVQVRLLISRCGFTEHAKEIYQKGITHMQSDCFYSLN